MAFIFGHRKKSPVELVKSTKKHIDIIEHTNASDDKTLKKVRDTLAYTVEKECGRNRNSKTAVHTCCRVDCTRGRAGQQPEGISLDKISLNLSNMKFMLYGDAENEPKEADMVKLVEEIFHSNLLLDLINMKRFEFEARKDVAQVYNFVLRQKKQLAVEYVKAHPEILRVLVDGYNDPDIALNCGSILREVIRHEELNEMLLNDAHMFDSFFEYVQLSTFDVASDAFATFKLMLTKHKVSCAKFLETHFDDFCKKYNVLLQSRNYVTKRQSLKLLGELLLNRSNFTIMMKYINSPENLKIMMNLLRGNTKAIQFEAFHVFKIFVANPKKSAGVVEILSRNKRKLIEFLTKFQKDKDNADEQFNEEKATLLKTLEALEDLSDTAPSDAVSSADPAASSSSSSAAPAAAVAASAQ